MVRTRKENSVVDVLNFNDAYNVELKECELYEDVGRRFLKLVYEYETDRGIYQLIIPQVGLNIPTGHLPIIQRSDFMVSPWYTYVKFNGIQLPIEPTSGETIGKDGKPYKYENATHLIKVIEEKQCEMTIEEIEKNLGYKVKIVSAKGE